MAQGAGFEGSSTSTVYGLHHSVFWHDAQLMSSVAERKGQLDTWSLWDEMITDSQIAKRGYVIPVI
jgi:hypothetical protein